MKKIFNYQSYKLMMQYISRIFFKSVSTYVCFFSFCIILVLISLLPFFFQDFQQSKILDYIFYIEISLSCIAIGVQTILKTAQIFLESQNDGDDIIIITKPINRFEIWVARSSFLLIFGFSVSFFNTFLINIGSFLIAKLLTPNNFLLLTVGALGAQFITFLLVSAMVLFLGSIFGLKIGRSIPATIFACSYIIANFINVSGSYISSNPITIINNTFNNEVTNYINNFKNLSTTDPSQNYGGIVSLSSNNKSFTAAPSNKLIFQKLVFKDSANSDIEILINDKNCDLIFKILHNSFVNKDIKANPLFVAIDYINPMSGILKIARTNVENEFLNDSAYLLSKYSNYYNIAPSFSNNKYYNFDTKNQNYYTTLDETRIDEPWMLSISWSSVAILIFVFSSLMYYRRELK